MLSLLERISLFLASSALSLTNSAASKSESTVLVSNHAKPLPNISTFNLPSERYITIPLWAFHGEEVIGDVVIVKKWDSLKYSPKLVGLTSRIIQ